MARAVAIAAGAGDVQGVANPVTLVGYSIRETTAAVAVVQLRDGTGAGDPLRVSIGLAAGSGQVASLPAIEFGTGIFVDRTSGTTELILYIL